MVRLQDCPPCQMGDHDNHYADVHRAPPGVIGGVHCPCKGECRENVAQRQKSFLARMGIRKKGGLWK